MKSGRVLRKTCLSLAMQLFTSVDYFIKLPIQELYETMDDVEEVVKSAENNTK